MCWDFKICHSAIEHLLTEAAPKAFSVTTSKKHTELGRLTHRMSHLRNHRFLTHWSLRWITVQCADLLSYSGKPLKWMLLNWSCLQLALFFSDLHDKNLDSTYFLVRLMHLNWIKQLFHASSPFPETSRAKGHQDPQAKQKKWSFTCGCNRGGVSSLEKSASLQTKRCFQIFQIAPSSLNIIFLPARISFPRPRNKSMMRFPGPSLIFGTCSDTVSCIHSDRCTCLPK